MGTWGATNFENDGACDYVVKLVYQLLEEIELNFSSNNVQKGDFLESHGEHTIIPALDIFLTLSETYDIPPKIDKAEATQWRQNYLDAFDRDPDTYPAEFKAERRKAIAATFDRLDALIADWDIDSK